MKALNDWVDWSRWFEAVAEGSGNMLIPVLAVHIAGWADNVGAGWGLDDGIVADIARRYGVSTDAVWAAAQEMKTRGLVSLDLHDGGHDRNATVGRVVPVKVGGVR